MRMHETEKNIADERRILQFAADRADYDISYNPIAYSADALFHKNDVGICFAEARKRNVSISHFENLIFSVQKYVALLGLGEVLPVYLFVEWQEGIHSKRLQKQDDLSVQYVKQNCPRDIRDNEPCVLIPTKMFRKL